MDTTHITPAKPIHFQRCNWCRYRFARLAGGEVDLEDVWRHKQHCVPSAEDLFHTKQARGKCD